MYYDPEANKHGADYGPFDNTMAFSDVSIRAGKISINTVNIFDGEYLFSSHIITEWICFLFFAGFIRKVSYILNLNFKTAELGTKLSFSPAWQS